jgi:acyl-CoA reductase-like NAD-dependent aldehyde dehydrogenase
MNAVWKFFTDNALARWVAGLLVALLGWEAVKRHLKDAGRQAERQASAVKQAQAREAVVTRTAEIMTEERHHADAAITARDNSPGYPDADSVPDEISAILFRSEGRDKAD